MIYPLNNTEQLEDKLFKRPTAEYRGIPFWSWNCKITEELIDRQLDCFKEMGFGGVDVHPRAGLDTEYLGQEYMRFIQYTVERCKEKGLLCWLYDDERFPSGVASGIVTKNRHHRGRFLLLTEKYSPKGTSYILPGYCENFEKYKEAIDAEENPLGYYVSAYSITFENGLLIKYRRLCSKREISDALARSEKLRFAYVKIMDEQPNFHGQTYVDTMNPDAIRAFIEVTHEAYYKAIGHDFGKTVPAIFTDEPRIGKHEQLSAALSGDDVTIPYSEHFAERMMTLYGKDPLDYVPEYIWELPEEKKSVNRYCYRNMTAECFTAAYMDQLCDWCGEHGILMTGHVLGEETLISQTMVGDCMRNYRKMDLPGIDLLCDFRQFNAVKQATSVTKQNGKEGTVSELYGVTHWDCDFKTFKLQGDWQAALGITIRVPHLSHMSLEGEAKRDWPPSIFFQSPWFKEFPYIEDYFARLNTVLTRGKAVTKIAVVHPVESFWLFLGPDDQTLKARRTMDRDFKDFTNWLLYGLLDFDFLSESLLSEQYNGISAKLLSVGEMAYSTVIVPELETIRGTTLKILESFEDSGGKVVFMGKIPKLVDASESNCAQKLAQRCICIGKQQNELLNILENQRDVEILKSDGCRADNLFYQLREDGDSKWLFVCHVNRYESDSPQKYDIRIKGAYSPTIYDAMSGETWDISSFTTEVYTTLSWTAYSEDSLLLRLSGSAEIKSSTLDEREIYQTITSLAKPDLVTRQEPNMLLLDYASARTDDNTIYERDEILKLDNKIRVQFGFTNRCGNMYQPWAMKEKESHKITLHYDIQSEIDTEVMLAIENPEKCNVFLNGEKAESRITGYYVDPAIKTITIPSIHKGANELVIETMFNQKTNLENLYLLGDFEVGIDGNALVIKAKQNIISLGDITEQGMSFYTGNLDYKFSFSVQEQNEYFVRIPYFKSPVLAVYLDGNKKGVIAYHPHRLSLGNLDAGKHELVICLYGNRFNGFGTLHNANKNYLWYGADSFRTIENEWTDNYLVRPVGIMSEIEIIKIIKQ